MVHMQPAAPVDLTTKAGQHARHRLDHGEGGRVEPQRRAHQLPARALQRGVGHDLPMTAGRVIVTLDEGLDPGVGQGARDGLGRETAQELDLDSKGTAGVSGEGLGGNEGAGHLGLPGGYVARLNVSIQ
jgi:hypothetical protein